MSEDTQKSEDDLIAEWEAMASGDDTGKDNAPVSQERVLNQDEIDSLLGISEGSEKQLKGWKILTDSSKISYERLPMLEVVMDRFVRYLSTSLRNFTSENVDVSLKKMTSTRFGDYLDAIALPALIGVFKIEQWGTSGLITVDAPLIYSIVDILLGGRRSAALNKIEGRPFTTIECNLVERLFKVVLEDFSKSFEPLAPVHFRFERMETNPRFAAIVRPVNAAVLSRIIIDMEERGGTMEFLVPYASLEPVREQLLQMFMGEKFGQDNIWETHFGSEIWESTVSLDAILDNVSLSLKDVLAWNQGSHLALRAQPDSPVRMICGETEIFTGQMGQKNGQISVQITENHLKKRKAS
jgi:flagellar motor switch protein FliM